MAFHIARYQFALPYCDGGRVLDAGCGVGYGSAMLARGAREVVGIDYSERAIVTARADYGHRPNTKFHRWSLLDPPFPGAPFDAVVCFEVIEHLDPRFDVFSALAQTLLPTGVAIISTPNNLSWRLLPVSEIDYHVNMRTPKQLLKEARSSFSSVYLIGMRARGSGFYRCLRALDPLNLRLRLPPSVRAAGRKTAGVAADDDMTPSDIVLSRTQLAQSNIIVAVCRGPLHSNYA